MTYQTNTIEGVTTSTFIFGGPDQLNGGVYVIDDGSNGNLDDTIAFSGGVKPDEGIPSLHFCC
jgi:hypothetical protein